MRHPAECPRCPQPVALRDERWTCQTHGEIAPLWRPVVATYDDLADQLRSSPLFPTYLPWPLPLGWQVTDFAVVGASPETARATLACCSGTTDLDGPVDLIIVTEEAGIGLGGRCAGLDGTDPGRELADAAPTARIKVAGLGVALWSVSTSGVDDHFDRAVFAGEADGRWLWLILKPASAMLLLQADWMLQDISDLGPTLLEVDFGGPPPAW
jgi:hypothetical protein